MKSNAIWYPEDCALVLIDFQPEVIDHVHERDLKLLEVNVVSLAKMAVNLNIPVVLSTVAVKLGIEGPTIPSLKAVLPDLEEIDRTTMNAWEDEAFVETVRATGRKKLVMAGIVTSVCLTFAAVSAMAEGYEVMFVEDAVGDRSKEEHDLAVKRLIQAGAIPNCAIAMITEWFRDWASPEANFAREIFPTWLVEAYSRRGFSLPTTLEKITEKETGLIR